MSGTGATWITAWVTVLECGGSYIAWANRPAKNACVYTHLHTIKHRYNDGL